MKKPSKRDFQSELTFTASRSSGPGGQNVNKVNSKITLRFDIGKSMCLTDIEKEQLRQKLDKKINNDDELIIHAESNRSQLKNKEAAIKKFYKYLERVFKPKKKRKPTKPTKAAVKERLKKKKEHSEKKKLRKRLL